MLTVHVPIINGVLVYIMINKAFILFAL